MHIGLQQKYYYTVLRCTCDFVILLKFLSLRREIVKERMKCSTLSELSLTVPVFIDGILSVTKHRLCQKNQGWIFCQMFILWNIWQSIRIEPSHPPALGNMLDSALVPESTVLEGNFDITMSKTDSVNVFNSYNKMWWIDQFLLHWLSV